MDIGAYTSHAICFSALINEILSEGFGELLRGLIGGGCPCRPASNALSLTKRSDHGKRLPESHAHLFYPSSGALTPVKEERESQAERGLLCGGRSDMTFHTGILHSDY